VKVLVSGGAGFIGSNTVDALIEAGHEVVVVDDLSVGKKSNLNPSAVFYETDIRDEKLSEIFEKEKPDAVIHHAAQVSVRESVKNPTHDASINLVGSINLLEGARKNNVKKFVYASTGGVIYGEPEYLPCDEKHPVAPICPYGASKYAFEQYLKMYHILYGMDYTILRYANVYGPRQDPLGEAGVIAIFAGLLFDGKNPIVFGDGDQTRDYVYVGDVVSANLLALEKTTENKLFNIATAKETSVNELGEILIKEVGVDIRPKHTNPVVGEIRNIHLDASLAEKQLGWTPKVGLRDGIKKTIKWMRGQS